MSASRSFGAPARAAALALLLVGATAQAQQSSGTSAPKPVPPTTTPSAPTGSPSARSIPHDIPAPSFDVPAGDAIFLELAAPIFGRRLIPARRVDGRVYLPARLVAEFFGYTTRTETHGGWSGALVPGVWSAAMLADSTGSVEAIRLGERIPLLPEERDITGDTLYLVPERLATLLGVHLEVDWPELQVLATGVDSLPLAHKLRREQVLREWRQQAGARQSGGEPLGLESTRRRMPVGGFASDYGLTVPASGGGRPSLTYGVGTEVLWGALRASATTDFSPQHSHDGLQWSWLHVRPGSHLLQQVQAGRVIAPGPEARGVDGILLTNTPHVRSGDINDAVYEGQLGPGWLFEAYRAGQLVAVDSTDRDGHWQVRMPVGYGENVLTVVGYGPNGERRTSMQTYHVPFDLLPTGRVEYSVGGGRCATIACRRSGTADVRAGLGARVVAQAGVSYFDLDSASALGGFGLSSAAAPADANGVLIGSQWLPHAGLAVTPFNALTMGVTGVARTSIQGRLHFEPSPAFRLSGSHLSYAPHPDHGAGAPIGDRLSESIAELFLRAPGERGDRLFLDLNTALTRYRATKQLRATAAPTFQARNVVWQPYLRYAATMFPDSMGQQVLATTTLGARATISSTGLLRRLLGGGLLTVQEEAGDGHQFGATTVTVYRPLPGRFRLGATVDYHPYGPTKVLTAFSLTIDAPGAFLTSRYSGGAGTPAAMSQTAQGGLAWDGVKHRLVPTLGSALDQGAIAGVAFVDANANGRRDAGELPVDGVLLTIGSQTVLTNERGEYSFVRLPAFLPVAITVDTTGQSDQSVTMMAAGYRVTPAAHRTIRVDLPFVAAATIEGAIVNGPETEPLTKLGGIPIIAERDGDHRRVATTTFSDGTYYLSGVAPGTHQVRIDTAVVRDRRWCVDTRTVPVPAERRGAVVADQHFPVTLNTDGFCGAAPRVPVVNQTPTLVPGPSPTPRTPGVNSKSAAPTPAAPTPGAAAPAPWERPAPVEKAKPVPPVSPPKAAAPPAPTAKDSSTDKAAADAKSAKDGKAAKDAKDAAATAAKAAAEKAAADKAAKDAAAQQAAKDAAAKAAKDAAAQKAAKDSVQAKAAADKAAAQKAAADKAAADKAAAQKATADKAATQKAAADSATKAAAASKAAKDSAAKARAGKDTAAKRAARDSSSTAPSAAAVKAATAKAAKEAKAAAAKAAADKAATDKAAKAAAQPTPRSRATAPRTTGSTRPAAPAAGRPPRATGQAAGPAAGPSHAPRTPSPRTPATPGPAGLSRLCQIQGVACQQKAAP